MTTRPEATVAAKKAGKFQFSLDSWAVTLALLASLLVWMGWIKQVPW
jgi:hypothetical protein